MGHTYNLSGLDFDCETVSASNAAFCTSTAAIVIGKSQLDLRQGPNGEQQRWETDAEIERKKLKNEII